MLTVNRPDRFTSRHGRPAARRAARCASRPTARSSRAATNIAQGYYRRPEATAESWDDEGWFHTGDIGEIDADGFLRITDRKKDLIKTSGGKYVAPQKIENLLKLQPHVSQAVVIGDNRKYCVALITLDAGRDDALGARTQGLDVAAPRGAGRASEGPRADRGRGGDGQQGARLVREHQDTSASCPATSRTETRRADPEPQGEAQGRGRALTATLIDEMYSSRLSEARRFVRPVAGCRPGRVIAITGPFLGLHRPDWSGPPPTLSFWRSRVAWIGPQVTQRVWELAEPSRWRRGLELVDVSIAPRGGRVGPASAARSARGRRHARRADARRRELGDVLDAHTTSFPARTRSSARRPASTDRCCGRGPLPPRPSASASACRRVPRSVAARAIVPRTLAAGRPRSIIRPTTRTHGQVARSRSPRSSKAHVEPRLQPASREARRSSSTRRGAAHASRI